MPVTGTFTHHGANFGVETTPVMVGGIVRQNIATNSTINGEATSGNVYRHFQALYSQQLAPGFTTYALDEALGQAGVLGLNISSLTNGFDLFAKKNLDGASRDSGAVHRQFNFNKGIVYPVTLTVDHQGDATLDYALVTAWDGTNDPMVITDDVTLTSEITDNKRFTLAKATICGVNFDGKRNWSIDFGLAAAGISADSDIWDTMTVIRTVQPQLTLSGLDIKTLSATGIPLRGKVGQHADTTIFLRKRSIGGDGFVPDNTTEHISISGAGLCVPDDAFSSDGQADGETSFTMPFHYDGTNTPIQISTGVAIP